MAKSSQLQGYCKEFVRIMLTTPPIDDSWYPRKHIDKEFDGLWYLHRDIAHTSTPSGAKSFKFGSTKKLRIPESKYSSIRKVLQDKAVIRVKKFKITDKRGREHEHTAWTLMMNQRGYKFVYRFIWENNLINEYLNSQYRLVVKTLELKLIRKFIKVTTGRSKPTDVETFFLTPRLFYEFIVSESFLGHRISSIKKTLSRAIPSSGKRLQFILAALLYTELLEDTAKGEKPVAFKEKQKRLNLLLQNLFKNKKEEQMKA